jgi:hypothetical protein
VAVRGQADDPDAVAQAVIDAARAVLDLKPTAACDRAFDQVSPWQFGGSSNGSISRRYHAPPIFTARTRCEISGTVASPRNNESPTSQSSGAL